MRILHLITRMDGGGSAVNTLLSATGQAGEGHNVVLACGLSTESGMSEAEKRVVAEGIERFRAAGGDYRIVPSLMREIGWGDLSAYREIRVLLCEGFDIVHTHTSKAGVLGRLAAAGRGGALVHTPHGHIFHGYFSAATTKLFAAIERWLAGRTDALIALTAAERDDHLQLGIGQATQWFVVPSGVDIDAVAKRVQTWRQANPDAAMWDAVSVGRLVPVKGMGRLLAAWALVCERRPDARLAIVGDGGLRGELKAQAEALGIAGNIHFAGWCDPVPYLAAAKRFVLLSLNEGMGRVVVEAMAAELPCIVADVCGLRELVDEHIGACVDGDNAERVAGYLLAEYGDDVRRAAGERARHYAVQAMLDGLQEVYRFALACET